MEQKSYRECILTIDEIRTAEHPAIFVLNELKRAGFIMKGGKSIMMCRDTKKNIYRQEV